MKKLPFVQPLVRRFRESPINGTPAGIAYSLSTPSLSSSASSSSNATQEARRPFRLWMTGSLAVVMAAVIPMRDVSDGDRNSVMRLLRHSRFGVNETVHRIELAARNHGLPVLALVPGARSVLVLGSSIGGTLVVMDDADSRPSVPLSLMIRQGRGGTEILLASASTSETTREWQDLPAAVVSDIQGLPGLVDQALSDQVRI